MVELFANRNKQPGHARTWSLLPAIFRRQGSRLAAEDVRSARLRRLGEACSVLEGARALVEQGWLQDRWSIPRQNERPQGDGTSGPAVVFGTDARKPPPVAAACLVGAVVHATGAKDTEAGLVEAGPALDILWDAWQESRGLGGPGVAGRAAPREVRAARVRDLTRWNDRPGRTREEVLRLLDLATARAIMAAANTPPVGAAHER